MSEITESKSALSNSVGEELLSEYAYCKLPTHYFESPGKIYFYLEKRERPFQANPTVILAEHDTTLSRQLVSELRNRGIRVLRCDSNDQILDAMGSEILLKHSLNNDLLICDLSCSSISEYKKVESIASEGVFKSIIAFADGTKRGICRNLERVGVICCTIPITVSVLLNYLENYL